MSRDSRHRNGYYDIEEWRHNLLGCARSHFYAPKRTLADSHNLILQIFSTFVCINSGTLLHNQHVPTPLTTFENAYFKS